jgi:ABC-type oligopeptide transport system substrate-binding subunit
MKKLMSTMLALALVVGTATVTFAQADDTKKATTKKGKGSKKNKDDKGDTKSGDAKAKKGSKKGKDAKDAPTK